MGLAPFKGVRVHRADRAHLCAGLAPFKGVRGTLSGRKASPGSDLISPSLGRGPGGGAKPQIESLLSIISAVTTYITAVCASASPEASSRLCR